MSSPFFENPVLTNRVFCFTAVRACSAKASAARLSLI